MSSKLKEFKLVRKVTICEQAIVDAKSVKAALRLYESGEVEGWEEEDVSLGTEEGLIEIQERGKDGEFSITHDVENGELADQEQVEGEPKYPREDVCQRCGKHIGWIMNPLGEMAALDRCEDYPNCK